VLAVLSSRISVLPSQNLSMQKRRKNKTAALFTPENILRTERTTQNTV